VITALYRLTYVRRLYHYCKVEFVTNDSLIALMLYRCTQLLSFSSVRRSQLHAHDNIFIYYNVSNNTTLTVDN